MKKSCSPYCSEYFQIKFWSHHMSFLTYDVIFGQKMTFFDQFWQKLLHNASYCPFKVIFGLDQLQKSCFSYYSEYFKTYHISFLMYDVIFVVILSKMVIKCHYWTKMCQKRHVMWPKFVLEILRPIRGTTFFQLI